MGATTWQLLTALLCAQDADCNEPIMYLDDDDVSDGEDLPRTSTAALTHHMTH